MAAVRNQTPDSAAETLGRVYLFLLEIAAKNKQDAQTIQDQSQVPNGKKNQNSNQLEGSHNEPDSDKNE